MPEKNTLTNVAHIQAMREVLLDKLEALNFDIKDKHLLTEANIDNFDKTKKDLLKALTDDGAVSLDKLNNTTSLIKKFLSAVKKLISDYATEQAIEDIYSKHTTSKLTFFINKFKKFTMAAISFIGITSLIASGIYLPLSITVGICVLAKYSFDLSELIVRKKQINLFNKNIDHESLHNLVRDLDVEKAKSFIGEKIKNEIDINNLTNVLKDETTQLQLVLQNSKDIDPSLTDKVSDLKESLNENENKKINDPKTQDSLIKKIINVIKKLNDVLDEYSAFGASQKILEKENSDVTQIKSKIKSFCFNATIYLGSIAIALFAPTLPVAIIGTALLISKVIFDVITAKKEKNFIKLYNELGDEIKQELKVPSTSISQLKIKDKVLELKSKPKDDTQFDSNISSPESQP